MSKLQNWFDELNRFEDSLPCPHCLEGLILLNYSDPARKEVQAYQCRNEKCYAFSEWTEIKDYYHEFKRVLERINDGYFYPKKVHNFINGFQTDKRRSKTFCDHCNSKIEKYENHLPVTKEIKGKISKYCEIRINRKKK